MDRVIVLSHATRTRLERRASRGNPHRAAHRAGQGTRGPRAVAGGLPGGAGHPPGTVAALTCARLEPEKNLPLLVELAARLRGTLPPVRFLVAGEGSCRAALERLIRSRGLEGEVTLLGLRRDVPALLAAADLFLLPSRTEELPLSLLEAMAAGLPVLAAPVGALPEIVPASPRPASWSPRTTSGGGPTW